jgi:hypothetical protein
MDVMPNKYLQIHRRLLFHWTKPPSGILKPKNSAQRKDFVRHIEMILKAGLRFSVPQDKDHEYLVKDEFEIKRPMVCFTESTVGESGPHSQRYGSIGFGFTRRFILKNHGRPVIYFDRAREAVFTKSILIALRAARQSSSKSVREHVDRIVSFMKAYNMPGNKVGIVQPLLPEIKTRKKADSHDHLRIRFGGLRKNLEDREWRVVLNKHGENTTHYLEFSAGQLALLVLPDHQTLSLALNESRIVEKLHPAGQPAVCVISRDMLPSIRG